MDAIKKMLERRKTLLSQSREIAEKAAEENRAFSAEEQQEWDAFQGEIDALKRRADAMLEGEQRAKETEDTFAKLEGAPPSTNGNRAVNCRPRRSCGRSCAATALGRSRSTPPTGSTSATCRS